MRKHLRRVLVPAWLVLGVIGVASAGHPRALIDAVKSSNREAVRALLQQKAAVNAREADGTTAVHWAVVNGDADVVDALIHAGADVNSANQQGVTPLALAASNGNAPITDRLIHAGADARAAAVDGTTVLMTAARTGAAPVIRSLIDHGADVNAREHRLGETALMWAAAEDHADAVALLLARGADANAASDATTFPRYVFGDGIVALSARLPRGGWSPLMYAARQGAVRGATELAKGGADLDAADPDGTTALVLAIENAHNDVAARLLEYGADPNIVDTTGTGALYAAVEMDRLGEAPGRPAPKVTGIDGVELVRVLLEYGADPNARLNAPVLQRHHSGGDAALGAGATPFLRAAKDGDVAVMQLLLAHGADAHLTTTNQTTAVMFAAGTAGGGLGASVRATTADRLNAITLCLQHGVDIDAVNDAGQTALHVAVSSSDEIVLLLAKRHARLDIKDKQGRTPLDIATGVGGRGGAAAVRASTAALLRELSTTQSGKGLD
jgi:uncharacterized protein